MAAWPNYQSLIGWLTMAAMAFGWMLASAHSEKP